MILLILIGLFSFSVHSSGPEKFDKYYANLTHYVDETGVKQEERFFIDVKNELGVAVQYLESEILSIYHIDKDDTKHSYMIIESACFVEEMSFDAIDVHSFILDNTDKYIGVDNCDGIPCEKWSMKSNNFYYARKDNGAPIKVMREEKNLVFDFHDFKFGKDCFDETTKFKLPVDPSICE